MFLDEDGMSPAIGNNAIGNSSDNCGFSNIVFENPEFDCSLIGLNSYPILVTDTNGNEVSGIVEVEVLDTIAPEIDCFEDLVFNSCDIGTVVFDNPLALSLIHI